MSDKPISLEPVEEVPTICIAGDPGAGKTRLASLWPDAYFLDAEGGAGSAVPPTRRKSFKISKDLVAQLRAAVQFLLKLPYKDKRLDLNGTPIGAVVLDSLDAIQQVHKIEKLLEGGQKYWREPRQMWGRLLDDMVPLVFDCKKLPIPTIWIAHIKIEEPVYIMSEGNMIRKQVGWRGIAVQGSLEDQIMRWFDYCLHLYVEEDFQRSCIVQPTIYHDYRIQAAKDRHGTFKALGRTSFKIALNEETGFPTTKAMQVIYDRHVY